MFASGRDMNMMLDMIEKSHVDGDLIINNGTQYRNIEGTKNIAHPMDEDAFRKMIPILQKYNYHISIHTLPSIFQTYPLIYQINFVKYQIFYTFL